MTEPVSADAIREEIRASLRRLRRLGDEGRIVMAEDSWNTDWHDSAGCTPSPTPTAATHQSRTDLQRLRTWCPCSSRSPRACDTSPNSMPRN